MAAGTLSIASRPPLLFPLPLTQALPPCRTALTQEYSLSLPLRYLPALCGAMVWPWVRGQPDGLALCTREEVKLVVAAFLANDGAAGKSNGFFSSWAILVILATFFFMDFLALATPPSLYALCKQLGELTYIGGVCVV